MKLLILNKFNKGKVLTTEILPRVGDSIDMFYTPFPTVSSVVLYPTQSLIDGTGLTETGIDAIIMCD